MHINSKGTFCKFPCSFKSINYIKGGPKKLKLTKLKASCWHTISPKCSSLSKAVDSWPRPLSAAKWAEKGEIWGSERSEFIAF